MARDRDYNKLAGRRVSHPGGGWSGELLGEVDGCVRIQWHDGQVHSYSHSEVDEMKLLR